MPVRQATISGPVPTSAPQIRATPVIDSAGLVIDRRSWAATVDGRTLPLTYLEFQVLDFLVRNPEQVFSRAALQNYAWGHRGCDPHDTDASSRRSVDVLIARLRRKLGPGHRSRIETVRQVGYRFRHEADVRRMRTGA